MFHSISLRHLMLTLTLCLVLCCACSRQERAEHTEEPARPHDPDQACAVMRHDPMWAQSLLEAQRGWGAPVELTLAIIRHESSFRAYARPHDRHQLGLFSRSRTSSAYGYPQALDRTWRWYQRSTRNLGHRRDHFPHAVNFIGWYLHLTHTKLRVPLKAYKRHYLAYHEGHRGFKEKRYISKKRLVAYA